MLQKTTLQRNTVLFVLIALLITSCQGAEVPVPNETSMPETAPELVKVGWSIYTIGTPFGQSVLQGAQDAASDLGAQLIYAGTTGFEPQMIAQIVSDQVSASVDGVVSPGTPQNAAIFRDLEIPYATFDLMDPELPTLHTGPKQYATGKYLGTEMVKALGGESQAKGVVLVGICVAGLELLEQRAQGIVDGLSTAPGIEIIGPFATHTDLSQNYAVYEQQYSAHPDAVAVVGTCSTDTVSIGQLNTANGMKYIGFGFDVTPETLQVVSDGSVKLTMGQGAYLQGYVPVLAVVEAAREGKMLDPGFFDSTLGVFEPVTIGNWSMHMDFFDHPEKMKEYYLNFLPSDLNSAIQPIDAAFK